MREFLVLKASDAGSLTFAGAVDLFRAGLLTPGVSISMQGELSQAIEESDFMDPEPLSALLDLQTGQLYLRDGQEMLLGGNLLSDQAFGQGILLDIHKTQCVQIESLDHARAPTVKALRTALPHLPLQDAVQLLTESRGVRIGLDQMVSLLVCALCLSVKRRQGIQQGKYSPRVVLRTDDMIGRFIAA